MAGGYRSWDDLPQHVEARLTRLEQQYLERKIAQNRAIAGLEPHRPGETFDQQRAGEEVFEDTPWRQGAASVAASSAAAASGQREAEEENQQTAVPETRPCRLSWPSSSSSTLSSFCTL